jgi:hypothetical protein
VHLIYYHYVDFLRPNATSLHSVRKINEFCLLSFHLAPMFMLFSKSEHIPVAQTCQIPLNHHLLPKPHLHLHLSIPQWAQQENHRMNRSSYHPWLSAHDLPRIHEQAAGSQPDVVCRARADLAYIRTLCSSSMRGVDRPSQPLGCVCMLFGSSSAYGCYDSLLATVVVGLAGGTNVASVRKKRGVDKCQRLFLRRSLNG